MDSIKRSLVCTKRGYEMTQRTVIKHEEGCLSQALAWAIGLNFVLPVVVGTGLMLVCCVCMLVGYMNGGGV